MGMWTHVEGSNSPDYIIAKGIFDDGVSFEITLSRGRTSSETDVEFSICQDTGEYMVDGKSFQEFAEWFKNRKIETVCIGGEYE